MNILLKILYFIDRYIVIVIISLSIFILPIISNISWEIIILMLISFWTGVGLGEEIRKEK
ncbi:MAG: hypothetical protein A3H64_03105 [Candidatus Ryanbacteria bacterium RIFCSPLOWO2_02_FULL_45_11c]|uniref:Uncharacterized protein n=1 Tax=Candidatus Ryanbacteria bacterium RIFCSPLOWO2_02_FULL_45_11c TaxID=1802128 RepID=A0A1G2H103_9BACT|nr:MAG: hypothetical protein A3H64_03105 [Candidatus Ryanbacteria bacterium RIFCSPLOWO2_02_FULL_45_11c]